MFVRAWESVRGAGERKLRKLKRVRAEARGQQGREGKIEREGGGRLGVIQREGDKKTDTRGGKTGTGRGDISRREEKILGFGRRR